MNSMYHTGRFIRISGDFYQNLVLEKSGLILMKLQEKDSKCSAKHHSAYNNPRTTVNGLNPGVSVVC